VVNLEVTKDHETVLWDFVELFAVAPGGRAHEAGLTSGFDN